MKINRLTGMLLTVAGILCVPLIAMQFTHEVNWTFSDFVIMGILMALTVFIIELALRLMKKRVYRIIVCSVVLAVFFLIYVELAVGIFGSPFAGS